MAHQPHEYPAAGACVIFSKDVACDDDIAIPWVEPTSKSFLDGQQFSPFEHPQGSPGLQADDGMRLGLLQKVFLDPIHAIDETDLVRQLPRQNPSRFHSADLH